MYLNTKVPTLLVLGPDFTLVVRVCRYLAPVKIFQIKATYNYILSTT